MMKMLKILISLGLILGLSACANSDAVTRAAGPMQMLGLATNDGGAVVDKRVALPLSVVRVEVSVPMTLRVSEANTWLPNADIVWRGEERGNRWEQVETIFNDAAKVGTADLTKGLAVVAEVEVTRFHCLTEKTRATVGGNHAMQFMLTLRDATTGEIVDGPRLVVADTKASGGSKAIAEDYAGRTQRVVVERLAQVMHRELGSLRVNPVKLGMTVSQSEVDPAALIVTPMK